MSYQLIQGDALQVLPTLADSSIDLIVTDPPYFRVKGDWWDHQWDTSAGFIAWMGQLCEQWQRVLKPNGSLYVFASPKMAARVEVKIGETFNILNRIRWVKDAGWHKKTDEDALRSYLSPWEEIIFSEHYGADNIAKGEAGYAAKSDELRGFVFEPLRAYLDSERERAGVTREQVNVEWQTWKNSPKGGMASHWFGTSQWALPTRQNYEWLRETFSRLNHHGEYLRRDYEELRRDYEELRRPFSVTADVPYTDVWDFPTVQARPHKHVCEKPVALLEHIIQSSSKPGAVVLDSFMGSASTGEAALKLGREFVGVDIEDKWVQRARFRLTGVKRNIEHVNTPTTTTRPEPVKAQQLRMAV